MEPTQAGGGGARLAALSGGNWGSSSGGTQPSEWRGQDGEWRQGKNIFASMKP
jgi:hypothetical protein